MCAKSVLGSDEIATEGIWRLPKHDVQCMWYRARPTHSEVRVRRAFLRLHCRFFQKYGKNSTDTRSQQCLPMQPALNCQTASSQRNSAAWGLQVGVLSKRMYDGAYAFFQFPSLLKPDWLGFMGMQLWCHHLEHGALKQPFCHCPKENPWHKFCLCESYFSSELFFSPWRFVLFPLKKC